MTQSPSSHDLVAVRVLTQPGWRSSGPDHWQTHWERRLGNRAERVEQRDWTEPDCQDWLDTLRTRVADSAGPVVILAHSVGCITVARLLGEAFPDMHAAPLDGQLRAVVLVAPADIEREGSSASLACFAPIPTEPLPVPALLIASTDDPYCTEERAHAMAAAWRADLHLERGAGHINADSGHGPWPEGWETIEQWLVRHGLTWGPELSPEPSPEANREPGDGGKGIE